MQQQASRIRVRPRLRTGVVAAALALASLGGAGCGEDTTSPFDNDLVVAPADMALAPGDASSMGDGRPEPTPVDVTADIDGDTRWTADRIYRLKKHVFVMKGTLTIEPGTRVLGDQGSSLVITRDAKIAAVGTAQAPIVFTSSRAPGSRKPGDWGGVVLLGKAPVNEPTTLRIEGFPETETRTVYGGTDAMHDCGRLKYARIEFAGFELAPNRELNGLSLGACGAATEIDYLQVHKGSDDGVEVFGGTVNLRHVVVTQPDDDGLDWDFGWTGKAQFIVVQQSKNAGDNGIEADSHPDPNHTLTPIAAPIIYNMSLIGSDAAPQGQTGAAFRRQNGILFRRGTAGKLHNVILGWFADNPIDVTNPDTVARTGEPHKDLFLKSSILFDNGGQDAWNDDAKDKTEGTTPFDEGAFFKGEPTNAPLVGRDPMLGAPLDIAKPDWKPKAGSPALDPARAATPPSDGWFDAGAKFIGAVGETDWTAGWTAYPES